MKNAGFINSSFTLFFVPLTVLWANIFSSQFPDSVESRAFAIMVLYSFGLYLFIFFLRQFSRTTIVLNLILLTAFLFVPMHILSAVWGPLAPGDMPVIVNRIIGTSYLVSGVYMQFITGAVLLSYGLYTVFSSLLSAALIEFLYNRLYKVMPSKLKKLLRRIDSSIDNKSDDISIDLFAIEEIKGVLITCLLLIIFISSYVILLKP